MPAIKLWLLHCRDICAMAWKEKQNASPADNDNFIPWSGFVFQQLQPTLRMRNLARNDIYVSLLLRCIFWSAL